MTTMPENLTRDDQLFFDGQMADPISVHVGSGTVVVFTDRCPGKPTANEDAAGIIYSGENAFVLVVADGVGGTAGGEQASRTAVQSLQKAIHDGRGNDVALRTAIINGIEQANRAVRQLGTGAATTIAIIEVDGNMVRPYHVGDSGIVLVGGQDKVKLQTMAHSPVGYGIEAGLLDEHDAMDHEDRHIVSNVIGAADMRIDIGSPLPLRQRDTVFLASDGVFDNLSVTELVNLIYKGPLDTAAKRLCRDCRLRMQSDSGHSPSKPDDTTFILFRPRR